MTTLTKALALVLGASALALAPSSTAQAASTCQGLPATIEASYGSITGTPGDDVIVAYRKVTRVDSGDGHDVICVVKNRRLEPHGAIEIDAGPGDDIVDTSRARVGSFTTLGPGADRFLGSSFHEAVYADDRDPGPDRVRTKGGADHVRVSPGVELSARLGSGDDRLELFSHAYDVYPPLVGPGAVVRAQFGAGDDILQFHTSYAGPDSEFLMGTGRDSVGFEDDFEVPDAGETSLIANLAEGVVTWHEVTSVLRDAESLGVTARRVDVRGTSSANRFSSMGCDVTFRGGAGEDSITMKTHNNDDEQPFTCAPGEFRSAFGDAGPDHLVGGRGHDELFGGPGRDDAYGGPAGDDVCVAEIVSGKGCGIEDN